MTVSAIGTDNSVKVQVKDNGTGIAEQYHQTIFERFKQIETPGYQTGSGLGLAICKSIVEEHGGSIGVQSKEGEASTFWFRIPNSAVKVMQKTRQRKYPLLTDTYDVIQPYNKCDSLNWRRLTQALRLGKKRP
ncbi:MAG: hypothetical protein K2X93_16680 [Candidatus Obscuribacterales bacterium]|nr:hypothetical protein [Candidatus Obscuribacterales bacterium]